MWKGRSKEEKGRQLLTSTSPCDVTKRVTVYEKEISRNFKKTSRPNKHFLTALRDFVINISKVIVHMPFQIVYTSAHVPPTTAAQPSAAEDHRRGACRRLCVCMRAHACVYV